MLTKVKIACPLREDEIEKVSEALKTLSDLNITVTEIKDHELSYRPVVEYFILDGQLMLTMQGIELKRE